MQLKVKNAVDYTHIYCNQQEIKNVFRRLKNQDAAFQKALLFSHNKFYQKIMHHKRLQLQEDLGVKEEEIRPKASNTSSKQKRRGVSQQPSPTKKLQAVSEEDEPELVQKEIREMIDLQMKKEREEEQALGAQEREVRPEVELLMQTTCYDQVSFLQYKQFVQDPKIREQLMKRLKEHLPELCRKDCPDFSQLLEDADKMLFFNFRDRRLTIDQLRSRIYQKLNKADCLCLDDLKDQLHPSILTEHACDERLVREILERRKHWDYQQVNNDESFYTNPKCVKSLLSVAKPVKRSFLKAKRKVKSEAQSPRAMRRQNSQLSSGSRRKKKKLEIKLSEKQLQYKMKKGMGNKVVFMQKVKESLNEQQERNLKQIKEEIGQRSKEYQKIRVDNYCAPFDIKKLDLFMQQVHECQSESFSFPQAGSQADLSGELQIKARRTSDKLPETTTHRSYLNLLQKKEKKRQINKDLLFLRQMSSCGNKVILNEKDQYIIEDLLDKPEVDLDDPKKYQIRKPRPKEIISKKSKRLIDVPISPKKLDDLLSFDHQQQQLQKSDAGKHLSEIESAKASQENTPINGQRLEPLFELRKIKEVNTDLPTPVHNNNNNNIEGVSNSKQKIHFERNVHSQQHTFRPQQHSIQHEDRHQLRNVGGSNLNTSGVSKRFLQFVENLGIPIEEHRTLFSSQQQQQQQRIFSAQRSRPESFENSLLMDPTIMSEGMSSTKEILKKDYKSNAIAFRLAKKQADAALLHKRQMSVAQEGDYGQQNVVNFHLQLP